LVWKKITLFIYFIYLIRLVDITVAEQVGNLSSLTKTLRAETKLIAFTFKTKQKEAVFADDFLLSFQRFTN
jgi:hypothetical protein